MKRKYSGNAYIIFALICLIAFNTGAILIKTLDYKAKPVFHYEEAKVKKKLRKDNIFVHFFNRTSSIINLYQVESIKLKKPEVLAEDNEDDMGGDLDFIEDVEIIDELEEYEGLITIEEGIDNVSGENVPEPLNMKKLEVDKDKPYILLYHTHGSEAYSSLVTSQHHTTDRNYNVTTIGETISKVLEAQGHNVGHITKYHDIPSYNQSYSKSLATATEELEKNNNYKILLDVHRDGHDIENPNIKKNLNNILEKSKVNINGKDVATFFLVIGPESQNKEAVLNFAKYIKAVSDSLYPGLCTGIMVKPVGKYNQFLSDYSALFEVGNNFNTMEEAMETANLLGEILSIVFDKIQE